MLGRGVSWVCCIRHMHSQLTDGARAIRQGLVAAVRQSITGNREDGKGARAKKKKKKKRRWERFERESDYENAFPTR